uniref:Uncharacterized protein n=1 Tax=Anguilla anguilla TaxID=7936 RepID=A0A0E9VAD9_ANGAN
MVMKNFQRSPLLIGFQRFYILANIKRKALDFPAGRILSWLHLLVYKLVIWNLVLIKSYS